MLLLVYPLFRLCEALASLLNSFGTFTRHDHGSFACFLVNALNMMEGGQFSVSLRFCVLCLEKFSSMEVRFSLTVFLFLT